MNTKTIATALFSATLALGTAQAEDASSKQQEVICETKAICQQLSQSIQAQINELEKSDNPDFDKLDELQRQLIALENSKQNFQQETIANEQVETSDIQKANQKIDRQNEALEALRGTLLDNSSLRGNANVEKIVAWLDEIGKAETQKDRRDFLVDEIIKNFKQP